MDEKNPKHVLCFLGGFKMMLLIKKVNSVCEKGEQIK